jgi:hypothetical protein
LLYLLDHECSPRVMGLFASLASSFGTGPSR